jgi:hypothetical protein
LDAFIKMIKKNWSQQSKQRVIVLNG